jgi:hypothetical protein
MLVGAKEALSLIFGIGGVFALCAIAFWYSRRDR